jgi:nitrate reductase NapE
MNSNERSAHGTQPEARPHADLRTEPSTRQEEVRTVLFLTVVTAPVLAVAVVSGYGFLVWMYQLFSGDLPG